MIAEREAKAVQESWNQQLRRWVRTEIEGVEAVVLPELADRGVELFSEKPAFVRGLMNEMLRPIVYEVAQTVLAETRGEPLVPLGDEVVTRSEFKRRSGTMAARFARWMEHANGRHVNFMEMEKRDLVDAAAERERRAETELKVARFERRLAGPMKDGERVKDRYTPEQLAQLWEDVEREEEAD